MMSSIVKLVTSPILYFEHRVQRPAHWLSPVAAVLCYVALIVVAGVVSLDRAVDGMPLALHLIFGAFTVAGVAFLLALQAAALVLIDRRFVSETHGWRLVECTALASWTPPPPAAPTTCCCPRAAP